MAGFILVAMMQGALLLAPNSPMTELSPETISCSAVQVTGSPGSPQMMVESHI